MAKVAFAPCVAVLACILVLTGCGDQGNVGKVTGKVTLGGQPLAGALVTFTPTEGGSPSAGRTDSSGVYSLVYTRDVNGAEIGDHKVTISTYSSGNPDADPPEPAVPEKVPARYNTKTELTASVKAGSNTFDFPLEGEAEVAQPAGGQE